MKNSRNAIFYLLNKARIEIRLIRSKKSNFRVDLGWPRVWSQSTRMVETSPTMYNLCFYDIGNTLAHVWYSPAVNFVFNRDLKIIINSLFDIQFYKTIQIIENCENNRQISDHKAEGSILRVTQPESDSTKNKQQIKGWNHLKDSYRIQMCD
jgi:hypothetical protein